MAQYDLDLFQVVQRWHYRILKIFAEVSPGPATVVYDSRADNRRGYESQSEARHAALSHKAQLVALSSPDHPAAE